MEELVQKKSRLYRKYYLLPDGVKFEFKIEEGYYVQTIKFEEIGFDEQIHDRSRTSIEMGLGLSIMINIILLIVIFGNKRLNEPMSYSTIIGIPVSMSIFFLFFFKRNVLKFIVGNKNLSFWYDKKYKVGVDDFIQKIKDAKKQYMIDKYLYIGEEEDSFIVKNRLKWLKNEGYINEEELNKWISHLETRKIIRGE